MEDGYPILFHSSRPPARPTQRAILTPDSRLTGAALSATTGHEPSAHAPAPDASKVLTRAQWRRLAAEAAAAEAASATVDAQNADAQKAEAAPLTREDDAHVTLTTPAASDASADEFERAARLFSFTAHTPAPRPAAAAPEPVRTPRVRTTVAPAPRRRFTGAAFRRPAAASFSLSAMAIVGLLAVGTTTPAAALAAVNNSGTDAGMIEAPATTEPTETQAYVSASDVTDTAIERSGNYDVEKVARVNSVTVGKVASIVLPADVPSATGAITSAGSGSVVTSTAVTSGAGSTPAKYDARMRAEAASDGVSETANTWVSDPTSAIQWPFPVGVPISAAYGSIAYASQFARPHHGTDLTAGRGAKIHVIADGTVRIATEAGGDYGVTVVVDHIIDGQLISTRYGHMEYGSLRVRAGQKVSVGDVLGQVGSTGMATGPHLHFEVLLNGITRTDPMVWMYAHTHS